ncbi:MAG: guanylate kinase [Victivallaceae bacterium]|nr:guanylate kinase [Victivallaceae bacterium]MDD3116782.1 guanylate kinase [Victivallaceae bacterium]MDD3704401.1 guanylate kinase [Victivallaceae bacterium]MDD4318636.1 guanylate kinase [Victivallaceae bacterium]MDD5664483.1 guanylate kinase [Victivallaceae bacterium]
MSVNDKQLGMALIVSGPSGAGKTSICQKVRHEMGDVAFSVSCTTRPPRSGEIDGKDYFFLSREQFEKKISQNQFIEFAEVFGNYYGTLKSEVLDRTRCGRDVFLDIDIQGAMQIREASVNDPELAKCTEFVFIVPPSRQELERRLRGRQSDSEEQICKRLEKSSYEIKFWKKYDYILINNELEDSVCRLCNLIQSLRSASKRMPEDLFK